MYIVYKHTAPNGKAYVGITKRSVNMRWGLQGQKYQNQQYFWNAIQYYGWDNITHEILEKDLSYKEACVREMYYIKLWDLTNPSKGYNITHGGAGSYKYDYMIIKDLWDEGLTVYEIKECVGCGAKVVAQVLSSYNISATERIKRGETRKMEERTIQIMELWNQGKATGEIAELLNLKSGQVSYILLQQGISSKERMDRSRQTKGRKVNQYDKQHKLIKTYNKIADAGNELNISKGSITRACQQNEEKGILKYTAGGYIWTYAD